MKYTKNVTDNRVKKTKKSIRNAFIKLLTEKDFCSITVTDIAKAAEVNRKTFYNYYECIDDIMKEIIDTTLLHMFENNLDNFGFEWLFREPERFFKRLTAIIDEDFDLYAALFKLEEPGNLLQKVELLVKEKITAIFLEKYPEDMQNTVLICEYCTSGMFAAYRNWFNTGRIIPLEELSKKVCLMTQSCIESLSPNYVSQKEDT